MSPEMAHRNNLAGPAEVSSRRQSRRDLLAASITARDHFGLVACNYAGDWTSPRLLSWRAISSRGGAMVGESEA
jgi:hypothetical protein